MDELLDDELLSAGEVGDSADEAYISVAAKRSRSEALHRLVGDWQLLADLSFADLVLFVPDHDAGRFVVVAQMRPTTGPTAYQDDLVGSVVTAAERPQLAVAISEGRICRENDPIWVAGSPVREEALPVRVGGHVVAVVARATNLAAARTPSQLEIAYLRSANDLAQMLAEGRWPYPGEPAPEGGPRVGDGLIRLDAEGNVTFASPNALSAYRRLGHAGDLTGSSLAEVTRALAERGVPEIGEPVAVIARGRTPGSSDLQAGDVVVQLRALPLRPGGAHIGALVLVHDVTELRRRERALLTKDATIREIHHRVKNNLQMISSLLNLQAGEIRSPRIRRFFGDAQNRVLTLSILHRHLYERSSWSLVDFQQFISDLVRQISVARPGIERPNPRYTIRAPIMAVGPDIAIPVGLIVTEAVSRALNHDFSSVATPEIRIETHERGEEVELVIEDNGRDPPPTVIPGAGSRGNFGLTLIRGLAMQLGGDIAIAPRESGGTRMVVTFPMPRDEPDSGAGAGATHG
jgi:two-component system, sensor histidine kinase PdtaS